MNNEIQPLVSVIITTYKRPSMLKRAIKSVLNQSYKDIELIIVDDNNPETQGRKETEIIMNEFKLFLNIKYVKHTKNLNGAAARNTGIRSSKGEIICFLDDDDWYLKEKIKKQVNYLIQHPEYDAVYCGWERDNKEYTFSGKGDLTFEMLSRTNPIITNSIMMKKEAAINCGGWDERFLRSQEPAFLLRYFNCGYRIGVIKEILVKFDISDRSNMSNASQNEKDIDFFLSVHQEQINQCNDRIRNAKKIIYSYRYRSVLLYYLLDRDYRGALKLYLKQMGYIPLKFNFDLFFYFLSKIKRDQKYKAPFKNFKQEQ